MSFFISKYGLILIDFISHFNLFFCGYFSFKHIEVERVMECPHVDVMEAIRQKSGYEFPGEQW